MISKRTTIVLGLLFVAGFSTVAYGDAVRASQNIHHQNNQVKILDVQKHDLDKKLDQTIEIKVQSQEEVNKLEKQKQDLENEKKQLQEQLQAKAEAKAEAKRLAEAQEKDKLAQASSQVINAATLTQTVSAEPEHRSGLLDNCGDNPSASFIYGHESGGTVYGHCNTASVNWVNCIGIGQNCPDASGHYWLKDACPDWETNYDCQNAAFTNYATERYGSWAGAEAAWRSQGWW